MEEKASLHICFYAFLAQKSSLTCQNKVFLRRFCLFNETSG